MQKQWYEQDPARLIYEQKIMAARFPQFRLVREGADLAWVGTLISNLGIEYEVALYYPANFPDAPPRAYPINPAITSWEDRSAGTLKHQWEDGSLCLYYPDDRSFDSKTTAATVLAVAAAWFRAYEAWLASGKQYWPGNELEHN